MDWSKEVAQWARTYGAKIQSGASDERIAATETTVGPLPDELRALLRASNGIRGDTFSVLPVFNPNLAKTTWNSLERTNDARTTKFSMFEGDEELLKRFLVFVDIGGSRCGAFDRVRRTYWFEDDDELVETNLDLVGFIDALFREETQ
jgi:hypothetical protein